MTTQLPQNNIKKLYEQDFNLWLETTVKQISTEDFSSVDWENLLEELESLSARDKRELESRLEVLLNHLLKRIYVPSIYDNRGWELTIQEQRRQLQKLLKQSPSLRRYFAEVFEDCWNFALSQTKKAYPKGSFPDKWEYSRDIDGLLSEEFWLK